MASKHGNNGNNSLFGKAIFIVIILIIIAVGISIFVKSPKQNKENQTADERLISTWTTDGITIYEFDNKGSGKMILPSSEYKFTYVSNNNKLYIDFESDKATDSDYEYSFENDKLILKGINSTSGTYTFTKK